MCLLAFDLIVAFRLILENPEVILRKRISILCLKYTYRIVLMAEDLC